MKMYKVKSILLILLWSCVLFSWGCGKEDDGIKNDLPIVVPDEEQEEDAQKIVEVSWNVTTLSESVVWKYYHFDDLFSSNQFISVLQVDLSDSDLKVDIPYVESGFLKTSDAAINTRATAAINGSYFNTTKGGSTVFFKRDGEIINYTVTGFTSYRENVGFAVDEHRKVSIVKRPPSGWRTSQAETLLVSGPLLLENKKIVKQEEQAFNTKRHPRTAIGITSENKLIAVVVDGRSAQSNGMTIHELSVVMKALGCVDAMNLDGGGSSTLWVKNRGVVNHPSDNGKFDHEGERGVATIVSFIEDEN